MVAARRLAIVLMALGADISAWRRARGPVSFLSRRRHGHRSSAMCFGAAAVSCWPVRRCGMIRWKSRPLAWSSVHAGGRWPSRGNTPLPLSPEPRFDLQRRRQVRHRNSEKEPTMSKPNHRRPGLALRRHCLLQPSSAAHPDRTDPSLKAGRLARQLTTQDVELRRSAKPLRRGTAPPTTMV